MAKKKTSNMTKRLLSLILIIGLTLIPIYLFAQESITLELKKKITVGDILFQNTGSKELDKAIKDVTKTKIAKNYTHVGIVVNYKNVLGVLEANSKEGVVITDLDKFINRSKNGNGDPLVSVYRLKEPYHQYVNEILKQSIPLLGVSYDHLFLWNDNAMYCSELIYKVLDQVLVKNGITTNPFPTHAMTFKDKDGKISLEWKSYYKNLNHSIPEGKKGTNPNLMASTKHIVLIGSFY